MTSPRLDVTFLNETETSVDSISVEQHLIRVIDRLSRQGELALQPEEATGRLCIEVVFVNDLRIKALNQQYRKVDKATDVLSFEAPEHASADLLGSIVVSIETAERQAKSAGIALIDEIKLLTSHGLLHLLGYDHK